MKWIAREGIREGLRAVLEGRNALEAVEELKALVEKIEAAIARAKDRERK